MVRNQSIDALRALGALMVFAFHAGFLGAGWIGVPLFFVVSGYLIGGRLLESADREMPLGAALRSFYWRRTVRIFPVYFLFMACVTVAAMSWDIDGLGQWLPYAWTYTANFFHASSAYTHSPILTPTWSLAVEEQFYLLFPFVVLLLGRRRLLFALIAMILAGPALRFATLCVIERWPYYFTDASKAIYVLGFTQVDAFAYGALVNLLPRAWCQRLGSLRCIAPTLLFTIGMGVLATGRLESGLLQRFLEGDGLHLVWGYTLIYLVAMMLLCAAVANPDNAMGRATPLLGRLGQWSYGFYLIHYPVIFVTVASLGALGLSLPDELSAAIALVVTTILAWQLYERVEKPPQALRHLLDRRSAQARSLAARSQA